MSNASRTGGKVFHGTLNDMEYFDKLPPTARQAMANAMFDWSAGAVYNNWKKAKPGWKTGQSVAARMLEWDRNALKRIRHR